MITYVTCSWTRLCKTHRSLHVTFSLPYLHSHVLFTFSYRSSSQFFCFNSNRKTCTHLVSVFPAVSNVDGLNLRSHTSLSLCMAVFPALCINRAVLDCPGKNKIQLMCSISAAAKTGTIVCPANERGTSSSPTKLVLKSSCGQIMLSVFWLDDNLVSDKKHFSSTCYCQTAAIWYSFRSLSFCPVWMAKVKAQV